jgi:hypothetical protein
MLLLLSSLSFTTPLGPIWVGDSVMNFLLFFRRGEAKRIRGPIRGVVSVHGSF